MLVALAALCSNRLFVDRVLPSRRRAPFAADCLFQNAARATAYCLSDEEMDWLLSSGLPSCARPAADHSRHQMMGAVGRSTGAKTNIQPELLVQ